MKINYLVGDATQPQGVGKKIIAHICNDVGKWGKGFVLAISKRWPEAESVYHETKPPLGMMELVPVEPGLFVANMVAQRGIRSRHNPNPIDYKALEKCLHWVGHWALKYDTTVHLPRIGTGLAGGTWSKIEPIIQKELCARGVEVFVYDLEVGQ